MIRPVRNQRRFGFTLIEMMVVMAIIAVLMSVAIPIYTRSILRAKESVLRNNLFTLRTVIDEYTYDKQKAPQSLEDLVSDGYLRQVPLDPMTGAADWKIIMEDATNTALTLGQMDHDELRSAIDHLARAGASISILAAALKNIMI